MVGATPEALSARTAQVEAAIRFAIAGVGLALVPANTLASDCRRLARPLDPPLRRDVVAYARAAPGRLADILLDHVSDTLRHG